MDTTTCRTRRNTVSSPPHFLFDVVAAVRSNLEAVPAREAVPGVGLQRLFVDANGVRGRTAQTADRFLGVFHSPIALGACCEGRSRGIAALRMSAQKSCRRNDVFSAVGLSSPRLRRRRCAVYRVRHRSRYKEHPHAVWGCDRNRRLSHPGDAVVEGSAGRRRVLAATAEEYLRAARTSRVASLSDLQAPQSEVCLICQIANGSTSVKAGARRRGPCSRGETVLVP